MKASLRRVGRAAALPVLLAACAALLACQLLGSSGLHGPFGPGSTASTTILVGPSQLTLLLFGSVQVASGQLQVRLVPPHGVDAFNRTFGAAVTSIDEQFANPAEGTWTLRVDSLGGTGQYDLTLKY
jgi:hypothetical protein